VQNLKAGVRYHATAGFTPVPARPPSPAVSRSADEALIGLAIPSGASSARWRARGRAQSCFPKNPTGLGRGAAGQVRASRAGGRRRILASTSLSGKTASSAGRPAWQAGDERDRQEAGAKRKRTTRPSGVAVPAYLFPKPFQERGAVDQFEA
jgi:hypothetical protein